MKIPEYKAIVLKEHMMTTDERTLDNPDAFHEFWKSKILSSDRFTPGVENLVVVMLNTRRRIITFQVVSTGLLDTLLTHPREIFKAAIVSNASAIIMAHNHPSGDPTPYESDIKVTRDMIRAGQLLKIDVLDHIIVGDVTVADKKPYCSLRELGYFYS